MRVMRHWGTFKAGRPGGATYRRLLKAVVEAGRPDLVATLDSDGDALEENFLVYDLGTETDNG